MARLPARPEETPLRLDANLLIEEFKPQPTQVRRWFTSNILQNAISILCGWTGRKPVPLSATESGLLNVATVSVPFVHQKVFVGTAGDLYSPDLVFPEYVDRVDVFVWDNPLVFKRAAPGGIYEEEIELPANSMYSVDVTTEKIAVKNKSAGLVARYQIVGWY